MRALKNQAGERNVQSNDAESVHTAARDIPNSYHIDSCLVQLVRTAAYWSAHQQVPTFQPSFEESRVQTDAW
jgi:hypothetical protein